MRFNQYLKLCRVENNLTQEQLVHGLYSHDTDLFSALDTGTLGKWERGVTKPKAAKQVSILKYFQRKTDIVLPCWENYSVEEVANQLSTSGMRNLIGKSKKHIYSFPSEVMHTEDIHVYPLRNFNSMDALLEMHNALHQDINHPLLHINKEQFKQWALHPNSLFLICEYKGAFIGLSFTTKVKPEIFDKILNFEITRDALKTQDFASSTEIGSSLMLGFFAFNEKAATLLFIRYYAYLIANQKYISNVGAISNSPEALTLISNMNLQYHGCYMTKDDVKIKAYKETLFNVVASEHVIKMILSD